MIKNERVSACTTPARPPPPLFSCHFHPASATPPNNPDRNRRQTEYNIRGIVAHLHAGELSITTRPAVSRGYLAVFSSEADNSADDGAERKATLGQAAGGGKLAFRDGAVQDLRLGGTTVLEGDLDMGGHRLLNFDMGIPDFDELEVTQTPLLGRHITTRIESQISVLRF